MCPKRKPYPELACDVKALPNWLYALYQLPLQAKWDGKPHVRILGLSYLCGYE